VGVGREQQRAITWKNNCGCIAVNPREARLLGDKVIVCKKYDGLCEFVVLCEPP
jgi:hypothetical protein